MNRKKMLISAIILVAVLGGAFLVYSTMTRVDKDDLPPQLSFGGSTFKGMFTDPGGYKQYEADDTCTPDSGLAETTLSSGEHYYYVREDLTVKQIVDRIKCEPFNKIRIMYKDPKTQTFYSWPEAVHNETTTLGDTNDLTILANTTFIIKSKDATKMGEIYSIKEPLPYVIEEEPVLDLSFLAPPQNPFNKGDVYGSVNDIYDADNTVASGWIGLVGTSDGTQLTDYLNTSRIADRVEKVFYKTGADMNSFTEAPIVSGAVQDADFSAGEYMVWLKLGEEKAVLATNGVIGANGMTLADGDDTDDADDAADDAVEKINHCTASDEDKYHVCLTTLGYDCDSGDTCAFIEVKEKDGVKYETKYNSCTPTVETVYDDFSESYFNGNALNIRAYCAPCSFGAGDKYACVTGASVTVPNSGLKSVMAFNTGGDACASMERKCLAIESKGTNNTAWGDIGVSCDTEFPDYPQVTFWNGIYVSLDDVRAECGDPL